MKDYCRSGGWNNGNAIALPIAVVVSHCKDAGLDSNSCIDVDENSNNPAYNMLMELDPELPYLLSDFTYCRFFAVDKESDQIVAKRILEWICEVRSKPII